MRHAGANGIKGIAKPPVPNLQRESNIDETALLPASTAIGPIVPESLPYSTLPFIWPQPQPVGAQGGALQKQPVEKDTERDVATRARWPPRSSNRLPPKGQRQAATRRPAVGKTPVIFPEGHGESATPRELGSRCRRDPPRRSRYIWPDKGGSLIDHNFLTEMDVLKWSPRRES